MSCLRVKAHVFLPSGAAGGPLRFQRYVSVPDDPLEHPGAQPLDLSTSTAAYAPSPFCPPLFQHVEEPVAHRGVGVNFAAFGRAAVGLVLNECTGCRTAGAAQGVLTWFCERSGDGLSWSPPARPLQVDTNAGTLCGGCAPAEHVPRAAAIWGPQTGQWRPALTRMSARRMPRRMRDQLDEEGRVLTKRCVERQWQNTCFRVKRLPCDHESGGQS